MCVWLLKCVLVGLDWVLPVMLFKYCTSHVHAYFMHTYLFFSFLFFVFVLWLCSLSFSLSLSLSLSLINCAMAPKAPWWVLFKCFRKIGCESLPCHELSSCKVFQEFVLGLDLFYISTSDYEFSDLRLLSWFIFLLWFCHRLPKGEIVKDIFM